MLTSLDYIGNGILDNRVYKNRTSKWRFPDNILSPIIPDYKIMIDIYKHMHDVCVVFNTNIFC